VVDEQRLYPEWEGEGGTGAAAGMLAARRALNELHAQLARDGYSQVYVDQVDPDVVAITRHEPHSRKVADTFYRAILDFPLREPLGGISTGNIEERPREVMLSRRSLRWSLPSFLSALPALEVEGESVENAVYRVVGYYDCNN
jgi:hypothetical protein